MCQRWSQKDTILQVSRHPKTPLGAVITHLCREHPVQENFLEISSSIGDIHDLIKNVELVIKRSSKVFFIFSRRFSINGKMPDYSSDCFFSSDYNPHTDQSTFLTILTILKSYNSYLANLKYWRKSLRSSIFTSSKKLKGTKGYTLRVFSAL